MLSVREERGVGGVFLFLLTKQGNNIQVCSWYPGDKESNTGALTTDLVLLLLGPWCGVGTLHSQYHLQHPVPVWLSKLSLKLDLNPFKNVHWVQSSVICVVTVKADCGGTILLINNFVKFCFMNVFCCGNFT